MAASTEKKLEDSGWQPPINMKKDVTVTEVNVDKKVNEQQSEITAGGINIEALSKFLEFPRLEEYQRRT